MIKIDIISGFLGAGKTTLIKKLLKEAFVDEQVVLIENEFGEIGIDGGFLKDAGIEIREMNSGCICCSLVGDFEESLKQVVETYHPDRIVIEPSGVGKLSDVVKAVEPVEGIVVNSLTTVADAKKCKSYMKNFGEFYNNQIESAGTIILSRTGDIKPERLEQTMALLKDKNPEAFIVTTPWDQLDGKKLLSTMEGAEIHSEHLLDDVCPVCGHHHDEEDGHHHHHDHDEHEHHHHDHGEHEHHHHHEHECHHHDHGEHEHHHHDCGCGHEHHHHHHADDVFASWGLETSKKFTKEEISGILGQLPETVLRAKGMVPAEDGTWIYFDYVPEEIEIRDGAPEVCGKICVIGSKMDEEAIAKLFK
ncbi:MAG: GTP-binding protein [Lachnospiraceae bacterium]|nr:GTP-binding protein [Lachnospiraceae bacterium]